MPFGILFLIAILAASGIQITFMSKEKRKEIGIQLPEPNTAKTSHK